MNRYLIKFLIRHLKGDGGDTSASGYNFRCFDDGACIPVAPEALTMGLTMHGDQYSNFNAGKIVNIIEGLGGLRYSTVDDSFTFADNLPTNWTYMEWRVPVRTGQDAQVQYVSARVERSVEVDGTVTKTVTVEGNPFRTLIVAPYKEEKTVVSYTAGGVDEMMPEHIGWTFETGSATVTVVLE